MLLVHIYIREHRSFVNVNIPLNGSFDCHVAEGGIGIHKKNDTSMFYHNYYCSALIGANGTGKSTALDFVEQLVISSASSGLAIFYDEKRDIFHVCLKNLPDYVSAEVFTGVNYNINKNPRKFIEDNEINLVKINNISSDLDILSLTRRHNHKNIHDCSRNRINNSISQKSGYFGNIFSYLKSIDGMMRYVESVYYEIIFKSSPRFLIDEILSSPMPAECLDTLTSWKKNYNPVVLSSDVIERGKGAIFQQLLEMNLISILSVLSNVVGGRETVLPLLLYRFVMLDKVFPAMRNIKLELEIIINRDERFEISSASRSSLNIIKMIEGHDSMDLMHTFFASVEVKAKMQEIFDDFDDIAQNIDDFSGGVWWGEDDKFLIN